MKPYHPKKQIVENCLTININELTLGPLGNTDKHKALNELYAPQTKYVLQRMSGNISIGFYVFEIEHLPAINKTLLRIEAVQDTALNAKYTDLNIRVEVIEQKLKVGGRKLYFVCPLRKDDGSECAQRVTKLYLPVDNSLKYFGCCICFELSYEST